MLTEHNIWQMAERYADGTLPQQELAALELRKASDSTFATEFNECLNVIRSMNDAGKQARFRSTLKEIQAANTATTKPQRTIPLHQHYWRTAAVAAGIALLTSLSTLWVTQHNNNKMASQYSLLKRDLETYKRSQSRLINNIQQQQQNTPAAEVRYTGTGFALTNDGYLVTNYHVTEGADSVYIQSRNGSYHKAYIVGYDQKADIAILKIEDKDFRFGKGELPYSFAPNKRKLGTKVYSLGFPQDEIVYNEGYISAKNGFDGDSSQYRLQMPAYPGQSGAPIIDPNGNVVAMITGKDATSEGTTYAVSSKVLMTLVQSLPKSNNIKLSKSNRLNNLTLEQQIEKLEYYTCSIKVYKK